MFVPEELERYERQIKIFGEQGQKKLKTATVFVAGAGGLGSAAMLYLAAAGIGHIRLIDRDEVNLSNLNRQILYREQDKGRKKTDCAKERLEDLNPGIKITSRAVDINNLNITDLIADSSVLVDALDNWPMRYVLNRAAVSEGIPLIHGAVQAYFGQVTTIIPGETGCLECIFPESPTLEGFPIVGPVCGLIGSLQALEVIKILLGKGSLLTNRLLVWDGLYTSLEEIPVHRSQDCYCGDKEDRR